MAIKPKHTCSFMYSFSSLSRDVQKNATSTYILGSGAIHSERFERKIGNMMYSQCLHDFNSNDNLLDARTTITAFFNKNDSITLHFFHPVSINGKAPKIF